MAEPVVPQVQLQPEQPEQPAVLKELRYLDFVHVAAIQALMCFGMLYEKAKKNAGPLKPGVQTVEGTVKAVVAPVYLKFQDLPYQVLKFVDRKVGDSVTGIERCVPTLVRKASAAAQKAPGMARSVATGVQSVNVVETATGLAKAAVAKYEPTAVELYAKYEPVAERYAVTGWRSLHKLPLFPQMAQIVVPTAAYWSDKYNGAVTYGKEKGYMVALYLPPVPMEKIAKVFGEAPVAAAAAVAQ